MDWHLSLQINFFLFQIMLPWSCLLVYMCKSCEGYTPRSGIAELWGLCFVRFTRGFHLFFKSLNQFILPPVIHKSNILLHILTKNWYCPNLLIFADLIDGMRWNLREVFWLWLRLSRLSYICWSLTSPLLWIAFSVFFPYFFPVNCLFLSDLKVSYIMDVYFA